MKNFVASRTCGKGFWRMARWHFLLAISACILGLHGNVHAQVASFDCAKASTSTERTICRTPSLGEKDVRMATYYDVLQTVSPAVSGMVFREFRGGIQEEQVQWIKSRRDVCKKNTACLQQAYDQRIKALQKRLMDNVGLTYGRMCDGN